MSTLNIVPKVIISGNGSDKIFAFGFPAENKTDVKVYVLRAGDNVEREIPYGDFDFNVVPDSETGGEIIYPGSKSKDPVLKATDKICIMRMSNFGNDYIFSNQTRLFPSSVEDADDALSLQILELSRDLAMSVKASVFDTKSPQERWNEISVELRRAQEILNFIDNSILTMPEEIQKEKTERQVQDAAILNTISQNKEEAAAAHSSLSSALEQEKTARQQADSTLVKKSDVSEGVVVKVSNASTSSKVALSYKLNSVSGGNDSNVEVALPVASEEHHGVMPKESFSEIKTLGAKVAALEGSAVQTYALNLGLDELTQQDYQTAWEQVSGMPAGSIPPNGTKLVNLDNNSEVQYFSTSQPNPWVVRGASQIPLATNTSSGVVKGTASTKGKVAVESDGSMSLVGYDEVVTSAANANSAAAAEASRAKSEESKISTNLSSHINDNTRHITASERTSWNAKYTKPSGGISESDLSASVRQTLSTAVTTTGGGTMAAQLVARSTDPRNQFETRNIKIVAEDPGVNSALETGNILFVYE